MASPGFEDIGSKLRGATTNEATAGVPYWGDHPDDYDRVTIAGFDLPGLCAIKGKGFEMRRQHKKPPGKHGASTIVIANEPAEFTISVMMTTEEHLRTFERVIPFIKPSKKPEGEKGKAAETAEFTAAFTGSGSRSAEGTMVLPTLDLRGIPDRSAPGYVSITHPMLTLFRISHCRILMVTIPVQVEDKGMWTTELHCIEEVMEGNRKAKVAAKTGDSGKIERDTSYTNEDGTLKQSPPSETNAGPPT